MSLFIPFLFCATYSTLSTLKQIKQLITRQNNKAKKIANGYIPSPKGRPRKNTAYEEIRRNNELVEPRMEVELLRNFLSEVGRR